MTTAAKAIEDQLDDELAKLDKLEDDDLERLREKRIQQLKKQATMRQQWLGLGHGEYQEIFNEKDFFAKVKTSDRVVCHFYRENWPCKVCIVSMFVCNLGADPTHDLLCERFYNLRVKLL